jgi:hypothetical protein
MNTYFLSLCSKTTRKKRDIFSFLNKKIEVWTEQHPNKGQDLILDVWIYRFIYMYKWRFWKLVYNDDWVKRDPLCEETNWEFRLKDELNFNLFKFEFPGRNFILRIDDKMMTTIQVLSS